MSWTSYLSNPLKKSHWTRKQARGVFEKIIWPELRDLGRESKSFAWGEYLKMLHGKGYITAAEARNWK